MFLDWCVNHKGMYVHHGWLTSRQPPIEPSGLRYTNRSYRVGWVGGCNVPV